MSTRYRNAFFGFSGFVTSAASAKKAQPAKTKAGRGAAAPAPKAAPTDSRRLSASSKAA